MNNLAGKQNDLERRIVLFGANGMLGSQITKNIGDEFAFYRLGSRTETMSGPLFTGQFDVSDASQLASISETLSSFKSWNAVGGNPKVRWWINATAYTKVDLAESNTVEANLVNAIAPSFLAMSAANCDANLLHFSTDYVFDGETNSAYTEESATNPQTVYGQSKLDGENAVLTNWSNSFVLRTSWLFGPGGNCFPQTIVKAGIQRGALKVVSDQFGCPTSCYGLANSVRDLLSKSGVEPGIYHVAGPEIMTWYDLAQLALETYEEVHGLDLKVSLTKIHTTEYPTPAKRPMYSVLDCQKAKDAGIYQFNSVKDDLIRMWTDLPAY